MAEATAAPPERRRPPALQRYGLEVVCRLARAAGPVRYWVADAGGLGAYALHPEAAARTARNHRRAAGGAIDAREARRRARASFREYGRLATDTLSLGATPERVISRGALVTGWRHLENARTSGRGAVLAMCHFGNWDAALGIGLARGVRLATVMAPVGPPWLTALLAWRRRERGLELLSLERAARGFLQTLRTGGIVGVMVDIPESGPSVEVEFCGGPVAFSAVAAWLACRTEAPILPVDCWRLPSHRHRLAIHAPIRPGAGEDEASVTQRLARVLEAAVLRTPEQWYPFHEVYADARGPLRAGGGGPG